MINVTKTNFGKESSRKSARAQRLTPWLNRFRQEEDGAVVAFTLYLFIFFLVMAGLGIDTMRHEMQRTRLAAVADAASLAGAAAPTTAKAKEVVRDYFDKIGMSEHLQEFGEDDVQITLNTAKVTVNTSVDVKTHLMKLSGVDTLSASATSTAEKRVPKLEIALVLDVSGSMRGDKLANLKTAAKQFVTTILASADAGSAVISIVPFSFGVTPSDTMYDAINVDVKHPYSTCIVFKESDFEDTAIVPKPPAPANPTVTFAQQIYTSRYDVSGDFDTLNDSWRSCYTDDYFRILPYSTNETELHAKIMSLQADGNTSGHLGIKWAAGLLDPAFRPATQRLIAANEVDASLTNVPAEYNELATQKVIVMMGDGANTSSYYFDDPNNLLDTSTVETHLANDFRGPNSDLWRLSYVTDVFDYAWRIGNPKRKSYNEDKCNNPSRWKCEYNTEEKTSYFLYDAGDTRFWDIDQEEWLSPAEFAAINVIVDPTSGVEKRTQLSWEMAWGLMSPDYHKSITGSSSAYNDYVYYSTINGSKKNTRMSKACTAAKADGKDVIIYTIGFEVSAGGTAETELRNCATSHSQYYRAAGVSITDAFNSIASNIQSLRLTQ